MNSEQQFRQSIVNLIGRVTLLVLGAAIAACPPGSVQAQGVPDPPSGTGTPTSASPAPVGSAPMSEAHRASLRKVVIMPGASPANQAVGGSYDKATKGLYGGMVSGSTAGTVQTDVGPVNVSVPIPILTLPGMIFGGVAGATQREIQEFRDALTEDLAAASSQQLVNEKIAADVYSEVRTLPHLEPDLFAPTTPVPADTDAILYVSIKDVTIDVQGKEAIITTTAIATVHRRSDQTDVYERTVQYQDRDALTNWTENDHAVWRDYANFARHYIGREVAAEVFGSVVLQHTLLPEKSSDVRLVRNNKWQGTSKTRTPTLAWELQLPGGAADPAWASTIGESDIYYDVEIYDLNRPVYSAEQVRGSSHSISAKLEPCQNYRWSVRPSYHVGGEIKHGQWMRSGTNSAGGNGNVGQKASEAPAYLYDFALLRIKCGSK